MPHAVVVLARWEEAASYRSTKATPIEQTSFLSWTTCTSEPVVQALAEEHLMVPGWHERVAVLEPV